MARPLKTYTNEEAQRIVDQMHLRLHSKSSYQASKDMKDMMKFGDALAALKPMFEREQPATNDSLRAWIDTHLSDEAWTRIQASMRQHKASILSRDSLTKMDKGSSWDYSTLAERAGVTKKVYLSALASWLMQSDAGQEAARVFASTLVKASAVADQSSAEPGQTAPGASSGHP